MTVSFPRRAYDALVQTIMRLFILGVPVHEYGHMLSLRFMGYKGEIRSTMLNAVWPMDYYEMSWLELRVFYLSGGMFQAMVFFALCLFNVDEENRLANKFIALQGLVYGLFEGLCPRELWATGSIFSMILSAIFMMLVLLNWSKKDS